MKTKKGFTLIELIVVMAVIGILVLLAAPKFMGFTQRAKETQIIHDVKVAENAVTEHLVKNNELPSTWKNVATDELNLFATEGKVYSREGLSSEVEDEELYKQVDAQFLSQRINTDLKGKFYTNKEGTVYFISSKDAQAITLTESDLKFIRPSETTTANNNTKIKVLSYKFPNGIYKTGDSVTGKIKLQGIQTGNYDVILTLVHSKARVEVSETSNVSITAGETKEITVNYPVTIANRIGFYDAYITVKQNSTTLVQYFVQKTVYIASSEWEYFYEDDFTKMNLPVIGQIGSIIPSNVALSYNVDESYGYDYGSADILIPANSNTSGQIKTTLPVTYGTYEARMKVPNSDALLNGFLLYGESPNNPSITYEIDLEVLRIDGKWQVWTTIHNKSNDLYAPNNGLEPGEIYQKKVDLSFDPSANFHNYRIDFYRNYTSFTVDGVEVSRWDETFDYGDMYIHAGNFYTHWLSKNIATYEQHMNIEWIRRMYTK